MSRETLALDDRLRRYVSELGSREHPAARDLRIESDRHPDAGMRSSAEQVALLAFLIELAGARRIIEIGCFTGYATLGMALALPEGGEIVTLDVNAEWSEIGRRYWRQAGVEDRICFMAGLALTSLDSLLAQRRSGFDLVYVDADKKTYDSYYEHALQLTRPGGLIALDNMLRQGGVADPDDQTRQTVAIRGLTQKIHADPRVAMCLLPVGDGLMLVRRR